MTYETPQGSRRRRNSSHISAVVPRRTDTALDGGTCALLQSAAGPRRCEHGDYTKPEWPGRARSTGH